MSRELPVRSQNNRSLVYMFRINTTILSRRPMLQRVSERVMIPTDVNPNINFVGLLIGPRGNTLKKIEKDVRLYNNSDILFVSVVFRVYGDACWIICLAWCDGALLVHIVDDIKVAFYDFSCF